MNTFAAVLNCMDGRVQTKAADYFQTTFGARNVDAVTAPGMVKHIATETDRTPQIIEDLHISLDKHGSTQVGVVAHADCAGNPVSDEQQKQQVSQAIDALRTRFPDVEAVGIWVDINGIVQRIN